MDLKKAEEVAKDVMMKNGRHAPQVIFIDEAKKDVHVMLLTFTNDKEKQKMLDEMREFCSRRQIPRYFVIMEMWMGKNMYVRPSQDPERKQGVLVTEYNRKDPGNPKSIINMFDKIDGRIVWGERAEQDGFVEQTSIWNFYLEDVLDEHMEQERLKLFYNRIPKEEFEKSVKDFCKAFNLPEDMEEKLKEACLDKIKKGMAIPKEIYDKLNEDKEDGKNNTL